MAYFILILGLLFAQVSSVQAQSVSIQIDGSGSMTGFDNIGELDVLINTLKKACDQAGMPSETVFFVSARADTVTWHGQKPKDWGGYTNLEAAFNTGYDKAPIGMMLTDNVQAASDLDARALYACFNRDTIKVLRAIPLKRRFDGVLFTPLAETGYQELRRLNPDAEIRVRSDGRVHYKGTKGFILYLFLTQPQYRSQYESLTTALQNEGMEPMVMKPIDDTILLRPGLIRPIVAAIHEKTQTRFNFTLQSRLSHINIDPEGSEFIVQPPQVQARRIQDRMLFGRRSYHYGAVSPPGLVDTLMADTQHTSVYTCVLHFGPFRPDYQNFWDYLNLARIDPVPADYYFAVSIEIPPNSFRMTEAYKARYFTDQAGVLDRIYTPTDLIQYLHQKPASVVPTGGVISGELQVTPLEGPWLAWIALILVLVGLIATILWIVFYPLKYRVTDSLNQAQEHTHRLRFGRKQVDLKISDAAGDETGFGNIKRDGIFKFALRPNEDVIVEDMLGNNPLEDLNAEVVEEESREDDKLLLEPGKALELKKGDVSITVERLVARF